MGGMGYITLTLTETCNLNCVYCYEEYKSKNVMTFENAIKILDKEFDSKKFVFYEISFHGGEPLLEFELIKEICEYYWARNLNNNYYFFATTNGTLLNKEMKEWFRKNHKRIGLGLSLDGTREVHNFNRSNSYDKIDFEFFKELWPNQHVKLTISDYTVPKLSESIISVHELGFNISANFAFGLDWSKLDLDILDRELKKLVKYYINNPNIEICSLLNPNFKHIDSMSGKWCGAGTTMSVYSTTGDCYPCHYFMDFVIGDKKSLESRALDFNNLSSFKNNECGTCKIFTICPTCYGYNYASTGDLSKRDKFLCEINKHCIIAASYLYYRLLNIYNNLELKIDDDERNMILHGIYVTQKYFSDKND